MNDAIVDRKLALEHGLSDEEWERILKIQRKTSAI